MSRLNLVDTEDMPTTSPAEEGVPDALKEGRNLSDERRIRTARTHRSWENNPAIHAFHNEAFLTLWREEMTGLTPRETELVILATVRSFGSKLEWNVHVSTAIDVGVSEEDVVTIFGGTLDDLAESDRPLARFVTAMAEMNVTDEVFEELATHYDDSTIVGILELAGFYALCSLVIDAMGIETVDVDAEYAHLSFERLSDRT